jgi:hypothetical protein
MGPQAGDGVDRFVEELQNEFCGKRSVCTMVRIRVTKRQPAAVWPRNTDTTAPRDAARGPHKLLVGSGTFEDYEVPQRGVDSPRTITEPFGLAIVTAPSRMNQKLHRQWRHLRVQLTPIATAARKQITGLLFRLCCTIALELCVLRLKSERSRA